MSDHEAPALAGVHHLKLPVADLRRSQRWYESRLGYELVVEFQRTANSTASAWCTPTAVRTWA